jgi:hypothetical protein
VFAVVGGEAEQAAFGIGDGAGADCLAQAFLVDAGDAGVTAGAGVVGNRKTSACSALDLRQRRRPIVSAQRCHVDLSP